MSATGRRLAEFTWLTPAGTAAGIASIAVLLMSCSAEPATIALPTESGRPPASRSTPASPSSDSEAVKVSYRQFVDILRRADSIPEKDRKQKLSTYMVDPQLSRVLKIAKQHQDDHLTTYGSVTIHIKRVSIDGPKATIHDCQNSHNAGLLNSATNRKINRGVTEGNTRASLTKGPDGRWRVSKYTTIGEGC